MARQQSRITGVSRKENWLLLPFAACDVVTRGAAEASLDFCSSSPGLPGKPPRHGLASPHPVHASRGGAGRSQTPKGLNSGWRRGSAGDGTGRGRDQGGAEAVPNRPGAGGGRCRRPGAGSPASPAPPPCPLSLAPAPPRGQPSRLPVRWEAAAKAFPPLAASLSRSRPASRPAPGRSGEGGGHSWSGAGAEVLRDGGHLRRDAGRGSRNDQQVRAVPPPRPPGAEHAPRWWRAAPRAFSLAWVQAFLLAPLPAGPSPSRDSPDAGVAFPAVLPHFPSARSGAQGLACGS